MAEQFDPTLREDSDKANLGIFDKYTVHRKDREDGEGRKHFGCQYFVLDLDHDKHARAAIVAYAKSCANEFPNLARDLQDLLEICRFES